jgi:RHS repeat-associated protein
VIALTDESGVMRTQYNYSPYGETQVIGEAADNPFQYTGRENDGTDLYAYRARYYSPEMRSFISEDPIRFAGGMNWYAYVGNRPVNLVDPLGLSWMIFDRSDETIYVYPGREDTHGPPRQFVAGNITDSESGGPMPNMVYVVVNVYPNTGDRKDRVLSQGSHFIHIDNPLSGRSELGVHGGRSGPKSPTHGCIRVGNESLTSIVDINQGDPLTHIYVRP